MKYRLGDLVFISGLKENKYNNVSGEVIGMYVKEGFEMYNVSVGDQIISVISDRLSYLRENKVKMKENE